MVKKSLARESFAEIQLRTGIHPRTLTRIVSGETETLDFDVADRIVTKLIKNPGLWQSNRALCRIFNAPRIEQTNCQCAECGHYTLSTDVGDRYLCNLCMEGGNP